MILGRNIICKQESNENKIGRTNSEAKAIDFVRFMVYILQSGEEPNVGSYR